MSNVALRAASAASFLFAALALGGCALLGDGPAPVATLHNSGTSAEAISILPPLPPLPRAGALPSNDPEDFVCTDGSTLHVAYAADRNLARVSLNGGPAIAMTRGTEDGLMTYEAQDAVFLRSGPRASYRTRETSLVVHAGDTLSLIADRLYGDRSAVAEIARINEVSNPDLIFTGQTLRLPVVERQCRRSLQEAAAAYPFATASTPLLRRRFSPPSARQPELRAPMASITDRPHR